MFFGEIWPLIGGAVPSYGLFRKGRIPPLGEGLATKRVFFCNWRDQDSLVGTTVGTSYGFLRVGFPEYESSPI